MLRKLAAAVAVSAAMIICASAVTVDINGTMISFDTPPEIVDGHTMVPMRAIFETLGAEVEWDQNTQVATATRGDDEMSLQIGSNEMIVNGSSIMLDIAPMKKNKRTLVPVRAISEALKCNVGWDGLKKAVHITDDSGLINLSAAKKYLPQYVTYSAFLDDVNGKPYCTRKLSGFSLVPVGYNDGMSPYNFCEYGGYVYYVTKTPGKSGYKSKLYRCNLDWTSPTLLGDGTDITFIIDHNNLYWNGMKIDLLTLEKTASDKPVHEIEGVSGEEIVSMTIHDSVCYYSKRDENNKGEIYEEGKTRRLGSDPVSDFYFEGGISGGYLYYSTFAGNNAYLIKLPVNGDDIKFVTVDSHEKADGGIYFNF